MGSRIKDRGGGGAKVMASKPQITPLLQKKTSSRKITTTTSTSTPAIVGMTAGKENIRSSSASRAAGVRWSTSSFPRRSVGPISSLPRHLRHEIGLERRSFDGGAVAARASKVVESRRSTGFSGPSKVLEVARRSGTKFGDTDLKSKLDSRNVATLNSKVSRFVEGNGALKRMKVTDNLQQIGSKLVKSSKISEENGGQNGKNLKSLKPVNGQVLDVLTDKKKDLPKKETFQCPTSNSATGDTPNESFGKKESIGIVQIDLKSTENSNAKKIIEEEKIAAAISNHPSKLHEKLALLEGKVQKIALDIKRTKEMLDQNNTNESKEILCDIQSKINGLEKAVDQVIVKNDLNTSKSVDFSNFDKSFSKVLNHEELEARFFPHHRLLKASLSKQPSNEEHSIQQKFLESLPSEGSGIRKVGMEDISLCQSEDMDLTADEKFEDYDENQENRQVIILNEENEKPCAEQLREIGSKSCTGGWFVSEGEAALLAHDDGSCTYYDITNSEVKSVYETPIGVSNNLWGDCWIIRAPGIDGCSGRYVVAASAGNTLDSGFCSWDFYTRDLKAFHVEDGTRAYASSTSRPALIPITNLTSSRRSSAPCNTVPAEGNQWWYRPCGPLIISTKTRQKAVKAYDIRDGELVMSWQVNGQVTAMEFSSPLQWRSRGKVVIAETDAVSLWDVNSISPEALLSVSSGGKKVYSLHVNNTDAELGGGVRQRVSSSDVDENDGVFCTQESINVLDFRLPSGIGHRIARSGPSSLSIFSRGDNIYTGITESRLSLRSNTRSSIQHFSIRKGRLVTTYTLPESNSHVHHTSLTQIWGNSNLVMGISGMGLFVFDANKDENVQSMSFDRGTMASAKETIGPDDLYHPTFDYLGSRLLLVSRDRPAMWRYLS